MQALDEMAAPKLSHTIQTVVGMVIFGGTALQRPFTDIWSYKQRLDDSLIYLYKGAAPVWSSESATYDLFAKCVLEYRMPNFAKHHGDWVVKRLRHNILACRDANHDINFMKISIASLRRVDLEQSAAIILSAIVNDATIPMREEIVHSLIEAIDPFTLIGSCMWITPAEGVETQGSKFLRLVALAKRIMSKKDINIGEPTDWASLLPTLLRIRRIRPSDKTRCLFIPQWIFDAANVDPPPDYPILDADINSVPGHEPTAPPPLNAIVLSNKGFRVIQRKILSYHQFWKPAIDLRKTIHDLEADVIYGASAIKRKVLPSNDTMLVAHYFMAIQRRLQRKIVSTRNGRFLAEGESGRFIQNTPHIPTAFEVALSKASGQAGMPIGGAALPQMDQCCLLMERYVFIYGGGDRTALVFRWDQRGGSGRGPVDEYNLLCDILSSLRKMAMDEGKEAPGPVRKFLAKDIMHCNDSWKDNAFADRFVPGWEPWLKMRRERGVLLSEWEWKGNVDSMVLDGEMSLPIR